MKDRAYRTPDQQVASVSIPQGRFIVMSRDMTCLIQYIDKVLCLTAGKATNPVIHIFGCEDGLDQGGEFIRDELASEQSSKGWTVEVSAEKEGLEQSTFYAKSANARSAPTIIRHGGHRGVVRIKGRRLKRASTQAVIFVGR